MLLLLLLLLLLAPISAPSLTSSNAAAARADLGSESDVVHAAAQTCMVAAMADSFAAAITNPFDVVKCGPPVRPSAGVGAPALKRPHP
jgi:hypothetical protein